MADNRDSDASFDSLNNMDFTDDEHDSPADVGNIEPYQFEPERQIDDQELDAGDQRAQHEPVNDDHKLLRTDWVDRMTGYETLISPGTEKKVEDPPKYETDYAINEVKGSNNMEKEGLIRAVKALEVKGLSVGAIITDKHLQIQKWVRENMPTTRQFYDVWHVAKVIPKLSQKFQTAEIEAYQSTINHFAPKMIGFSYHAMHFNENSGRAQASTKDGVPRYNIVFPKYMKGEYTIRETKVNQTFKYVCCLLDVTAQITEEIRMHQNEAIITPRCVPAPLCAAFVHPEKDDAVESLTTRFCRRETCV